MRFLVRGPLFAIFLVMTAISTPVAGESPPQATVDLVNSAVSELGTDPVIVEAVRAENGQRKTLDQIQILDEGWRATSGTPEFMRGWIDSDCGVHLREIMVSAPYYTLMWVTDEQGAAVAMSDKVPAYWYGESPCFVRAFDGGSGDVYVGEVERDSMGREIVQVCVPVIGHGIAIGVIHATIDINGIPVGG
jgi:hypothetical protein